jgi:hypothetical protein
MRAVAVSERVADWALTLGERPSRRAAITKK